LLYRSLDRSREELLRIWCTHLREDHKRCGDRRHACGTGRGLADDTVSGARLRGRTSECLYQGRFADVHYYFNDPSTRPSHHRFSRGSYVYIYHNPNEHRAKLEIANHAGTSEQDAFFGYLTAASKVRYSYKQPTLLTLILDGPSIQGQSEWHLPSYNERNEQKYLYELHTLDLYLWTEKDAATLLGHMKAVLSSDKLDIRDAPAALQAGPAEHRDSMSPVVQQLEKTAIGQHFPPRAESTASAHSFPGPPTPATSNHGPVSPPPQRQPATFAYNPAAPAAPEPIAHREKTPPPPDDGTGTGLPGSGRRYDSPFPGHTQYATMPQQSFQPSLQNTPQQSYFPGPPQLQPQRHPSTSSIPGPPQGTPPHPQSGALPPPPPPPGVGPSSSQRAPSFGSPPGQAAQPSSPPPTQTAFHRQSSFGPPVQQFASYPSQQTQYASYAPSPGFGPSITSPGMPPANGFAPHQQQQPPTPSAPPAYANHTPVQLPGFPPTNQALPGPPAHQSAQQQAAQIAGYSNYTYSAQQQAQPGQYNPQGSYSGEMHNQLYRPTEQEASHGARLQPQSQGGFSDKYRVTQRVDKVEKGVGKFLKKLDSKW